MSAATPSSSELPKVSCVMTAYNYERYVADAVTSVLEQDYPPELLDIVVVDDGSTDGTAEAVRERRRDAGERVTLIEQANAGLAAATTTAMQHAQGELLAICDADDEWLPGKVRRQVQLFLERPGTTLVYGDMQIVDAAGALLRPSYFAHNGTTPVRGRVLDALVRANLTTNSTLMFPAAHAVPVPAASPYSDYWLALHAAAAGEVEAIEEPLSNYRLHASNMTFGVTGEAFVRELRRELQFRRLALSTSLFESVSLDALLQVFGDFEQKARQLIHVAGTVIVELFSVSDAERARARQQLQLGMNSGEDEGALRACLRAWLLDPFNREAYAAVERLTGSRAERTRAREAETATRAVAGRRVTLADANELIATPALARSYYDAVTASDEATLVIVASADLEITAGRLRQSLTAAGLDPDGGPDMVLVPAHAAADLRSDAVLTARPSP